MERFALQKVKHAEHTSFQYKCESSVQNMGIY